MSTNGSPASRRRSASVRWCVVNFGFLPIWTPRALARSRPSPVRDRISSRSNSAVSSRCRRRAWGLLIRYRGLGAARAYCLIGVDVPGATSQ